MTFHVYVNRTRRRARLHRSDCSFVKVHGGEAAVADQDWLGPFDTRPEAEKAMADATRGFPDAEVGPCGACAP